MKENHHLGGGQKEVATEQVKPAVCFIPIFKKSMKSLGEMANKYFSIINSKTLRNAKV